MLPQYDKIKLMLLKSSYIDDLDNIDNPEEQIASQKHSAELQLYKAS